LSPRGWVFPERAVFLAGRPRLRGLLGGLRELPGPGGMGPACLGGSPLPPKGAPSRRGVGAWGPGSLGLPRALVGCGCCSGVGLCLAWVLWGGWVVCVGWGVVGGVPLCAETWWFWGGVSGGGWGSGQVPSDSPIRYPRFPPASRDCRHRCPPILFSIAFRPTLSNQDLPGTSSSKLPYDLSFSRDPRGPEFICFQRLRTFFFFFGRPAITTLLLV